jgi:dipeptidase E
MRGVEDCLLALFSLQDSSADAVCWSRVLELGGGRQQRIGYVASSNLDRRYYEQTRLYYAEAAGGELSAYVDPSSEDGEWRDVLRCDAIHLSSGNTFGFASWLSQDRREALRAFAASGRLLIGESAGAILLTPSVEIAALCGDERVVDGDVSGLGLVEFGFWPHYVGGAERRVDAGSRRLLDGRVMACPDGGAVIVGGSLVEVFGDVVRLEDGVAV